ncbi:Serine/threonine protein kinase [Nonomuraea solani]|uniref:Serine/threonine protein kinase n=1 Tax=Nonomuraea solani TaxID=1144553 RepID=A0A1H6EL72_9ACTN|nr:serine/threonine-protein kinase [Nonomuraea solani]SEG97851.1 Serine/threonine protein kinase [Nonomuraea solani]
MTVPRALEYQRLGEYRISARLGEGGQGTVYLGESPGGQRVAIKVLHARSAGDPETRRRFLREAEVAASVAAFCTARVLGTGVVDERPYLVSEYVPGPSLDELVKRDGPRSGSGLERLAVSTLTALASIHGAGVVHRDFKPANVILGPEGPVVIDFGIARALDHMTSNTQVAGTPSYMPPEQFTDQPLTPASDMFSWASTMVFAATGRTAFPGSSVPAILHAILHAEPNVSGVPEPLRPLVAACLAKDPAARPAAARLLRDLTGGDPNGRTMVDLPTEPLVRRRRSTKIAVAAVAAALVVTAGVLVVPSWLGGRNDAASLTAGTSLDLAALPKVEVDDRFAGDSSRRYATYRPFPEEGLPSITVGEGRFTGGGSAPFFGMVAGPAALSSAQAVSVLTAGTFTGSGRFEDSVFVGWVKDGDNYLTAWYNNTRKATGFDLRARGSFMKAQDEVPLTLAPGDRFALLLVGGTVTSYAEHGGKWRRLHTASIGETLATPQTRQQYRYGFGLRATTGTISVTRTEGRRS